MNFSGKVIVITGAASGLGRALAVQLADCGASLVLADLDAEGLTQTGALLKDGNHLLHRLDVANRGHVEQFRDHVVSKFGFVDIVINNAGVIVSQRLADTTVADFEWLMGVNFWGVVHGSQAFLPCLLLRPEAAIVNVSSIFGIVSAPGQGAYNTSKFAVRGFTETLRHELSNTPIHVMCVYPGGIKTNIARNAKFYVAPNMRDTHAAYIRNFDILASITPVTAANTILKALRRRRARCLIGAAASVMDATQRMLPSHYWPVLHAIASLRSWDEEPQSQ
jgi:NAD(P)-dependent dehydrogenase (short-subunit alcohol dehydrogenase family)